ncbi:insulinase family protein [Massilia sp. H-1]|nr:insulinase family protein [Massilia sp. H-1]
MLVQKSALPQIRFKLLFNAGSAHDPAGKEGLANLTAMMVASAGSMDRKSDEITKALFPMAGTFSEQIDKEMTTFTGSIHKDNWDNYLDIAMPMLLTPGFHDDDFRRLEGFAQERARDRPQGQQRRGIRQGTPANQCLRLSTPYGHPVLGTAKGVDAITLDDVKDFYKKAYTQGAVKVGISGDVSDKMVASLKTALAKLLYRCKLACHHGSGRQKGEWPRHRDHREKHARPPFPSACRSA